MQKPISNQSLQATPKANGLLNPKSQILNVYSAGEKFTQKSDFSNGWDKISYR